MIRCERSISQSGLQVKLWKRSFQRHESLQKSKQKNRSGILFFPHICDFSKASLVCRVLRVSQDVTAVCGDRWALQRHSVHLHQRLRPLQPPVTVVCLQPPACGGSKAAMTTPAHIWPYAVAPFMGHFTPPPPPCLHKIEGEQISHFWNNQIDEKISMHHNPMICFPQPDSFHKRNKQTAFVTERVLSHTSNNSPFRAALACDVAISVIIFLENQTPQDCKTSPWSQIKLGLSLTVRGCRAG